MAQQKYFCLCNPCRADAKQCGLFRWMHIQRLWDYINAQHVRSILCDACLDGNLDMVQQSLASCPGHVNVMTELGTPLCVACEGGNPAIVSLLLTAGACIEPTFLVDACAKGQTEVVRLLLNHREQPRQDSIDGFRTACAHGHESILRLLLTEISNTVDFQELLSWGLSAATEKGHIGVIRLLIEVGVEVNASTYNHTVLDEVCWNTLPEEQTLEVASVLIGAGAVVNDQSNSERDTPLSNAIFTGDNARLVALLVAAGADIERESCRGERPLLTACLHSRPDTVKLLLRLGANLHVSRCGLTPWRAASKRSEGPPPNADILRLLVQAGGVDPEDLGEPANTQDCFFWGTDEALIAVLQAWQAERQQLKTSAQELFLSFALHAKRQASRRFSS